MRQSLNSLPAKAPIEAVLPRANPVVLLRRAAEDRWVDLLTAERQLQAAQRAADIESLDALLHPKVVGAGPDGTVFTKEDDLASYRSGALRITSLVEESLDVQEDGQTGVTRMVAAVDAVQGGAAVSARLRYTRLWVREDGNWRVLAATFVPVF
ncbi:nuclear transport factor 2 family protein [Micromonospora radicis]|uniref:nuclear transport factor 2 family protein n=1 Tax=Micromonospora radicis TaxID=1894971 RepID=UPI001F20AA45|nr:nuclear transport factor 2 family protein [Micromonospora radicis]